MEENIFIFGNSVEEVEALKARGYNPYDYYNSNWELKSVIDWLRSDYFAPEKRRLWTHLFKLVGSRRSLSLFGGLR